MKERGWKEDDFDKLKKYFFDRVDPMINRNRKTSILWEEMLLVNQKNKKKRQNEYRIPQNSIVQAWTTHKSLVDIIKRGYKTLLSGKIFLKLILK
jgi:N-acetyl-beta-hexosaminidase